MTAGDFLGIVVAPTSVVSFSGFANPTDTMGNAFTFPCGATANSCQTTTVSFWTVAVSSGSDTITIGCIGGGCSFTGGTMWVDQYTNVAQVLGGNYHGNCGSTCPANSGTDSLQSSLTVGTGLTLWEPMVLITGNGAGAPAFTSTSSTSDGISPAPQSQNHCQTSASGLEGCTYTSISNANFPILRIAYTSGGASPSDDHALVIMLGGTTNPNGSHTICYGNCGSPAVTWRNTNSTHTLPFNSSITMFYQFQAQINGIVNNVTVKMAKSYSNGQQVQLGLYSVDKSCTATNSPFTAACPGIIAAISPFFQNPSKGLITLSTNVPALAGQWFGISVTASFTGLDLNDTNTAMSLNQASGQTPSLINSFSTPQGSSLMGLYAYITGQSNIIAPPVTGGCNTVTCGLIAFWGALGGDLPAGIVVFIVITGFVLAFFTILLVLLGGKQGIFMIMLPLSIISSIVVMAMLSAIGILPVYLPILIIIVSAWLFSVKVFWHRGGSSGGEA